MTRDALQTLSDGDYSCLGCFPEVDTTSTVEKEGTRILPKEREEVLTAIRLLHGIPENWRGFPSQKPTNDAISLSLEFATHIPLDRAHPDKIAPDGDGGVSLIWEKNQEMVIVTIDSSLLHLSHAKKNREDFFDGSVTFDGKIIPKRIIDHLPLR